VDVLADVVEQTRRLLARAGYPGIRVLLGDGFDGIPGGPGVVPPGQQGRPTEESTPFDRVVATVGCSDLSPHWAGQLADDGAMLIPLEHAGGHPLVLIRKDSGELRGQVVHWTGFMPVRGPLYIEDLWTFGVVMPDPGEIVHEPAAGPCFAEGAPGDSQSGCDEIGFLFFLGLSDRRACWAPRGVGLSDGLNGWAVADPDGISWWKDAALARELDRLYQDWDARGRPGMGDYRVSFLPIEQESGPPPGGWLIERRFYRELVTLGY
jgi:protein-L-isoaspartate(D-aspartate) O-methyltransferase